MGPPPSNLPQLGIDTSYPGLVRDGYEVTSPRTIDYNCIAWALGDDTRWWEDAPGPYYWPGPPGDTVEVLTTVFEDRDYEKCADGSLEDGYEKIAIYSAGGGIYTHAARQLSDGLWTSKIGNWEDITHDDPKSLESPSYGIVVLYMRRTVP